MGIIKNLKNDKVTRTKLIWTILILLGIQIGCRVPLPWMNSLYLQTFSKLVTQKLSDGFIGTLTGNSFSSMGIFALNVAPYISASIIIELLGVVIKPIQDWNKIGSVGQERKKKLMYVLTVIVAGVEAGFTAFYLKNNGVFVSDSLFYPILSATIWVIGAVILVFIGNFIKEHLIGEGVSLILASNVLVTLPTNIMTIFENATDSKELWFKIMVGVIIAVSLVLLFGYIYLMESAKRVFKYQGTNKSGNRMLIDTNSDMPIKVNALGVMPIIFASSVLSTVTAISTFFDIDNTTFFGGIVKFLTSANWFDVSNPIYSLGFLVYIVLIFLFSLFYLSISFNFEDMARNMKRRGEIILGVKPGEETIIYLKKRITALVIIGAAMLCLVALVPALVGGLLNCPGIMFTGTSLIIMINTFVMLFDDINAKTASTRYKKVV